MPLNDIIDALLHDKTSHDETLCCYQSSKSASELRGYGRDVQHEKVLIC